MKTILVTGASGFLGSHLIKKILERGDKVIAILGRPEDLSNDFPTNNNISVFPCAEINKIDLGHVDTLIHTAFSRGDNLEGLTASIAFSETIIDLVNKQDIDSIINISSQGLYKGLLPGQKVTEDGAISPDTAYGLAKWAVENMLKIGCRKQYTNIRMASLSANARFLKFFVNEVFLQNEIRITAPNQYASIMDVSDAVEGISAVEMLPISERQSVYNLGPETQYSILNYAESANSIGKDYGFAPTKILVDDCGKKSAICMDCSRLKRQTGWRSKISKDMMIHKLFSSVVKND